MGLWIWYDDDQETRLICVNLNHVTGIFMFLELFRGRRRWWKDDEDAGRKKKREDDEKWNKLGVGGSLLHTIDMQSNGRNHIWNIRH